MKRIENGIHGAKCHDCGKTLLYGTVCYADGQLRYCLRCGKSKTGAKK